MTTEASLGHAHWRRNKLQVHNLLFFPTSLTSGRAPEFSVGVRSCQHRMLTPNVFGTKFIGRAPEVAAEVGNTVKVRADGCIGKVAMPQLLKHELT
jgi:hypothetical protein